MLRDARTGPAGWLDPTNHDFSSVGAAAIPAGAPGRGPAPAAPLALVSTPQQETFVVTTLADVVDATDGVLSLREAVDLANTSPGLDRITFAESLRGGVIRLVGEGLTITDDLVIDGDPLDAGAGGIVISGQPLAVPGPMPDFVDFALRVEASTLLLKDATVRDVSGGSPSGSSVGIYGTASDLELVRVNVDANGATAFGYGVSLDGGTLALIDSTIQNTVSDVGAGLFFSGSDVIVFNSQIIGNGYAVASGIMGSGDLLITKSTIADNAGAGEYPGRAGIDIAGSLTLIDSTVAGNGPTGIRVEDGGLLVINSTVFGHGENGIAVASSGPATLLNSTVTGNLGSGLAFGFAGDFDVSVVNSIVLGNAIDIAIAIESVGGSGVLQLKSSIFDTLPDLEPPTGIKPEDVFATTAEIDGIVFGVLADNGGPTQTVALLDDPANPALDAADPAYAPVTDQRGFLRDATPDIGAFELGAPLPPLPPAPALPPLAEKVPLADADILGAPRSLLTLVAGDAAISFVDEYAAFQNSLGVYLVGPDGTIDSPQWVFERVEHAEPSDLASDLARPGGGPLAPGDTVWLSELFDPADLGPGVEFGLFLVADGWTTNPGAIFDVGTLEFRTGDAAARVTDSTPQLFHIAENGVERLVLGDIMHTVDAGSANPLSNTLNPGGAGQVTSGTLDGLFTVAFEDKPLAASDRDFNDAIFAIDLLGADDTVVAAAAPPAGGASLETLLVTDETV